jgi:Glycosyl transferase family 2
VEDDLSRVLVLIPALNEEESLPRVLLDLRQQGLTRIRVVDNGSTDQTATVAREAGAEVIFEPKRGYGQACQTGLKQLPSDVEWILFCDADGCDDLARLPDFFRHMATSDLLVGNRRSTPEGCAVMTPVQNFGNAFATTLIAWFFGMRYHDLGPLRLIRRSALEKIKMRDHGFGWTVEMQARAAECGLRGREIPVGYFSRRTGVSKISGTISGSLRAGWVICATLGYLILRRWLPQLWIAGCALLLTTGVILMQPYGDMLHPGNVPLFLRGAALLSLGFLLAWRIRRLHWTWFWGVAVGLRLLLLPMEPGDDIWRYVWEGQVQNLGLNPYLTAPIDVSLESLRAEWWSKINHPQVTAIYPPLTQLFFRLLAACSLDFFGFKLVFVALDLGVCYLLARTFGFARASWYAWNPMILYCFAGAGHFDVLIVFFLVLAWLVDRRKIRWGNSGWTAFFLGLSIAIKYSTLPVFLLLLWCRRSSLSCKKALVLTGIAALPGVLSLLFFWEALYPLRLIPWEFIRYSESVPLVPRGWFDGLDLPIWVKNGIVSLVIGGLWFWLGWGRRFEQFSERGMAFVLMATPTLHAWYLTWFIPFSVRTQNIGTRLVSCTGFIYFLCQHRTNALKGKWDLTAEEWLFLWIPFCGGVVWTVLRSRAWRKFRGSVASGKWVSH